jgi:hypothetical protein
MSNLKIGDKVQRRTNSKRGRSLIYARYGEKIRKRIERGMMSGLPRAHSWSDRQGVYPQAFSMAFLCF